MKIKIGLIALFSLTLLACQTPKQPRGYFISKNESSLAEASFAVSRSMVDLAESAQANHPVPNVAPPPPPASYGMGALTSVDWTGPVEQLVCQIAKAADYRVRVLGTPPAIPVLVTVFKKNVMLGDILRDVGYQTGRRASVVVFPETRTIELRYAKN